MKRVLSVFLTVAMLLCLPVTTFASEVEESQPSACTVHTLDELKAALAAAADGDSIAIADCIEISDETVSSDKAVKIVRSNGFTDDMFVLGNQGGLSGLTIEDMTADFVNTVTVAIDTENAVIERCSFSGSSANLVMFIMACGNAEITDCTFQTNGCLALSVPLPAAAVTVRNCTIPARTLTASKTTMYAPATKAVEAPVLHTISGKMYCGNWYWNGFGRSMRISAAM